MSDDIRPEDKPVRLCPSSVLDSEEKRRLLAEAVSEYKAGTEMRLNRLRSEKRLLNPAYP